jgi:hypothetical protein
VLALCLLHHAPEARRAAVAASCALTAQQPDLLGPLLVGLRHWANRPAEAAVLVVSASCAARMCCLRLKCAAAAIMYASVHAAYALLPEVTTVPLARGQGCGCVVCLSSHVPGLRVLLLARAGRSGW